MTFEKSCLMLGAALVLLSGGAQARAIHTVYTVKAGSIVGLTLDESGTIYGADGWGGGHNAGAMFEIAPDGSAKTLHNFQKDSGPAQPQARPLVDASGTVYGVGQRNGNAWGPIVFALNKRSVSTVTFFQEQYNSETLATGVTMDASGNLYGATCSAGANGAGNVFKITPDGTLSTLHDFAGTDGQCPMGDLVFDDKGNLFGTTQQGSANFRGSVFRVAADGTFSTLHSFDWNTEGGAPVGGVTLGDDGSLFGTTTGGGPLEGGTAYKLTPKGTFTVLHGFGGPNDGNLPFGTLARDAKGDFYGVTELGGLSAGGKGTLFKMTPSGKTTILHAFTDAEGIPTCALAIGTNGRIFGGTTVSGANAAGIVYELAR